MTLWRLFVQTAAGNDDDPARPRWSASGVPHCSESCCHHDGKRCRALGFRAPDICEPVVAQMAKALEGRR